ncbi:hypothetical protein F5887DRAFT_972043 [Amanita rubescens]|nr:hypothetical protein F5887DRAFT_972043 [Amanita rubescens]
MDVGGQVSLDGFLTGGNLLPRDSKSEWSRSFCRTSPTTVRDFSFASITFTANLGEIQVAIWTVLIWPGTSNAKGTHRVQFSDLREVPYARILCPKKVHRLATFVFRYRPLGGQTVLPPLHLPQQNNKRKLSESDAKEMDSSEPEIDQHVEELRADIAVFSQNLSALQDKLKQLESRRAKKTKVKVEKREHSPLLNEVIDLT